MEVAEIKKESSSSPVIPSNDKCLCYGSLCIEIEHGVEAARRALKFP